jgi:hypothetical protein
VLISQAFAVVVVLGMTALASAEPLDMKKLSASTKWAAHVDVETMVQSTLAKKVVDELENEFPEAKDHVSMILSLCQFDPVHDLHGITIYGTQLKPKTGVAIVHAKVNQEMLLDKAARAPEHQVTKYGKYDLHSWIHAKGSKHERTMIGVFFKPDVLVFGASSDEVKAALDVLDGTKPNFTTKESGLSLMIPSGSFIVAGVTGLSEADLHCKSPVAKKTDAAVMAIGEDQGNVFVVGQLIAKDPEISREMKTVLDGAVALAKIAKSDDADVMKLIDAVKISSSERAVNVECRASVDDVYKGAQCAIVKLKKAHAKHHEGKKSDSCPVSK